jgi:hypothetical protein
MTANDTVARLAQSQHARRVAAVDEYEQILGRLEQPSPGDEERLEALLVLLGRKPQDLIGDAQLFAELREAELLEGRIPVWVGESAAGKRKVRDLEEQREAEKAAVHAKFDPLVAAAEWETNRALGACAAADVRVRQLPILRRRRDELIGGAVSA